MLAWITADKNGSRRTWLGLGVVAVGLALVVWWPAPPPARVTVITGRPSEFRLVVNGLTQTISGSTVKRDQAILPLDKGAMGNLWAAISALAVDPATMLPADAAQAARYGCSDKAEMRGPGLWMRWGTRGDAAAVWDGEHQRLATFPVRSRVYSQFTEALGRLDVVNPVQELVNGATVLVADGRMYRKTGDVWREPARPLRLAMEQNVSNLLQILGNHAINAFAVPPVVATAAIIRVGNDAHGVTFVAERLPVGGRIRLTGLPPQTMDFSQWQDFQRCLTELQTRDAVMDPITSDWPQRIVLPNVVLERRPARGGEGGWEAISVHGYRAPAAPEASIVILNGLAGLRLRDLLPGPLTATTSQVRIEGGTQVWRCQFGEGNRGGDDYRHGTIVNPPAWLLWDVSDVRQLQLLPQNPSRVVAIQRRWGNQAEVFRKGSDGRWRRTYPATMAAAVDDGAISTWIARFASIRPARRQGISPANPPATQAGIVAHIAIRLDPLVVDNPGIEDLALADTAGGDQEWIWTRQADGRIRISDHRGESWGTVPDPALAMLLEPMASGALVPVLPGEVIEMRFSQAGSNPITVRRQGDAWIGPRGPVESWKIERCLRAAGEAPIGKPSANEAPFKPQQRLEIRSASLTVMLTIGAMDAAGRVPVDVDGRPAGWIRHSTALSLFPEIDNL